jgi:hypothetical protein
MDVWLDEPEEHDFPVAMDYLELLMTPDEAEEVADGLRAAPTVKRKAKGILRASELPLLPKDNVHVAHDIKKVKDGKRLSPILLVHGRPLVIADGYHRVCAVYYLSEDLEIPCRLV